MKEKKRAMRRYYAGAVFRGRDKREKCEGNITIREKERMKDVDRGIIHKEDRF
jgi:hypothetical protein